MRLQAQTTQKEDILILHSTGQRRWLLQVSDLAGKRKHERFHADELTPQSQACADWLAGFEIGVALINLRLSGHPEFGSTHKTLATVVQSIICEDEEYLTAQMTAVNDLPSEESGDLLEDRSRERLFAEIAFLGAAGKDTIPLRRGFADLTMTGHPLPYRDDLPYHEAFSRAVGEGVQDQLDWIEDGLRNRRLSVQRSTFRVRGNQKPSYRPESVSDAIKELGITTLPPGHLGCEIIENLVTALAVSAANGSVVAVGAMNGIWGEIASYVNIFDPVSLNVDGHDPLERLWRLESWPQRFEWVGALDGGRRVSAYVVAAQYADGHRLGAEMLEYLRALSSVDIFAYGQAARLQIKRALAFETPQVGLRP